MKYNYFKIFKLSAISKIIDFRRYNFSKVYKNINLKRYKHIPVYLANFIISVVRRIFYPIRKSFSSRLNNFSKNYKSINFKKYNFFKVYKYQNLIRYNFLKIYKYFDYRRYNISKIFSYFDVARYKYVPIYAAGILVFLSVIYLSIPMFFSYDKSKLENEICKGFNLECLIKGKIRYSFLPTPRIKIKDLIIKDFVDKTRILGTIDNVAIKLSFYNLSDKNKLNFTKVELQKAEVNFDLNNLKEYQNFFEKKFNSKPINLTKGEIKFFDGPKNVATIANVKFKYKTNNKVDDIILKGDFLNEYIYINLKNKKKENKPAKIFKLKYLDSNTKINIFKSDLKKNTIKGNISFKKGKNRLTSIFDYKDHQIDFTQANLRNSFLDGKFNAEVKLLPYFNFNLDVDLNSVNFNSLHSSLVALSKKSKKNLFKINEKINGQLSLSADKIFSKRTLIDSLESRIKFVNGNILIEQLLLNLGKLGAADVTGIIKNNRKFSNFKFENNIFIDNLKRFYNKFSIFNKQSMPTNLFVSGSFDLTNLQLHLDEISDDEKFKEGDVVYIEREFNDLLLKNGYESLFNFIKFKEFIEQIISESSSKV